LSKVSVRGRVFLNNLMFKTVFLFAVFCLFTLTDVNSSYSFNKSEPIDSNNTYVLAIGSCPPWQSLRTVCKNDVDLFVASVVKTMGIPVENVKEVVDSEATYEGVARGFDWLKERASDDSAVIVYYNGHGMLVSGIDGSNKEEVFVLWSEDFPFAGLYAVMAKIWMTDKELASYINQVPGRAKLVVADTCHAGGAEEYLEYKGKQVDYGLVNTALLAAAEAGQLAYATGDYGLFTLRLSDAMRNSSDLQVAFNKARVKTMEESRDICRELKDKKLRDKCKEQGPTIDDPFGIVKLFKLNTKKEPADN
jgi:hypothetical protein